MNNLFEHAVKAAILVDSDVQNAAFKSQLFALSIEQFLGLIQDEYTRAIFTIFFYGKDDVVNFSTAFEEFMNMYSCQPFEDGEELARDAYLYHMKNFVRTSLPFYNSNMSTVDYGSFKEEVIINVG